MPSFPDISGGPVWDRPLRGGIKPEERADDIRPYGRVENRDGGRMISAPTESPWPGTRRAHTVRPYESRETEPAEETSPNRRSDIPGGPAWDRPPRGG